ncbi:uncharacterized protein LOC123006907 isoform X1 [Tribolium madens]|uniref:uncharacterized protein LOC123006907 isoform X1 n=2 Tax=Tribolium madens TaxID=41895 RepID=UPI001CF75467|nr:uncharacterized protein LOC123006907 isoform X1 [Tribolium madens]XP_044257754.1 uncharacterized protein LOC123006907 isoform X1 [Tribolium madens]
MSRGYYNTGAPFLYSGGEAVSPGMDCLQLRQPPGPFHYLINEQAKSLVALQELQHEVGALLQFRDLVIETFPNLRTKLASSTPATMTSSHHNSNIPVSIRTADWTPGVRVRKKLNSKDETRLGKKGGDIAVQDSGFSTETSSKETHSASSTAPPAAGSRSSCGSFKFDETEDELWNLLDVIHRKGTRLKDEVEALQGAIREQGNENDFQRVLFTGSADDIRQLRQERDLLLDRLAEMEAEVLAGRVHTSRLQEDLENLLSTKHDLEEQLKAVVSQRGEVNSRIHDLHLQFVTKSGASSPDGGDKSKVLIGDSLSRKDSTTSQRTRRNSALDLVLGDRIPKVKVPDSKKIAAILKENDPLVLQKHLLSTTVQNQVLYQQLDTAARVEIGLADKLDKAREENDDLRFQLEDKNIELEGTRARVRMLEQLQKSITTNTSPDVIPDHPISRSEITTASMKAMSPLPLNLQMDHSSSTESAHDQAETNRKNRRPSKIPLKSYTAPKPPGGKHSPAPGARSRSGESPGRPHSAQSWRNRSEGNSLSGSKSNSSLPKSRNGSLVSAKDSLSSKLRSSDSLSKLSSNNNSFGSNRGTMRKSNTPVKWTNNSKDVTDKISLSSAKGKSQYPWTLSSYNSDSGSPYPDSLDRSVQPPTIETSSSHRFQTANTFLWNVSSTQSEFYDSIDSNITSSLYQQNGEDLAECDSLEKQLSDISDQK